MRQRYQPVCLIVYCVIFLATASRVLIAEGRDDGEGSDSQIEMVKELLARVEIVTDGEEVTHILADSDYDAFFAQGWVHARDRFFQMDHSRRLFSGTLAELVGPDSLDSDIQLRTLGIRRAAGRSWEAYPPRFRRLIEAYSTGVNAFLESDQFVLPPEYSELELSSVDKWTPLDSVTVIKGITFGLSFDIDDLSRTELLESYRRAGDENGFDGEALFFEDLLRRAPFDPSITVPGALPQDLSKGSRRGERGDLPPVDDGTLELISSYLEKARRDPFLSRFIDRREKGGSNAWVIGPELSESGSALIANDPHQSLSAPGVFHEIHLLVRKDPALGRMNVIGVSFPGVPGVAQGCNEDICWGSTLNPLDVTDAYEESIAAQLFPAELIGTRFEGEIEPFEKIEQEFWVNQIGNGVMDDLESGNVGPLEGGVTLIVPRRNNGPVVEVDSSNPFDVRGISIQYAGFSPTRELEATMMAARTRNVYEFREALQFLDTGSQNWICADREGNIAYFASAELPLREDLEAGAVDGNPPYLIRDGTHEKKNEWLVEESPGLLQALGFQVLPYAEMPQMINPEWGYLANANSDPFGVTLDNNSLDQFRPNGGILYLNAGYVSIRMGRIQEMIDEIIAAGRKFTIEDLRVMQADNQLLDAKVFVPYILTAFENASNVSDGPLQELVENSQVVEAVGRLQDWDFTTPTGLDNGFDPGDDPASPKEVSEDAAANSVAATIYAVWRSRFIANTVDAALERFGLENHRPDGERTLSALRVLLESFGQSQGVGKSGVDFFVVEGLDNAVVERDVILLRSLEEALQELLDGYGGAFEEPVEQADLRWGRLHRIRFRHPLGGAFDIPPSGPFDDLSGSLPGIPRAGGYETVDESSHNVRASGENGFVFGHGPARRFVAEMSPTGIEAYQVVPPGQSGRSDSDAYTSQLEKWLTNQYHPFLFSESSVDEAAADREILTP